MRIDNTLAPNQSIATAIQNGRKDSLTDWNMDLPEMTLEELKKCALEHGGYETPELNDILYLHYKGYRKIENLNSYVALKALYLDSNGFCNIENISHLSSLRCLFLHKNFISKIENLQGLNSLVQLDLSENRITKIEGLSVLPNLATLNLARNLLTDGSSISHLKKCSTQLTTLNLSFNQLQGQEVLEQLVGIASIIVLDMKDNPILRDLPHFRKKCIVGIPKLRSLDSPIFELERISAEAWAVGGSEAEKKAKQDFQERQREKDKQNLQQFRLWKDNARDKQHKAREQESLLGLSSEAAEAEKKRVEHIRSARLKQAAVDSEREKAAFRIEDNNDCADTFPTTNDKSFEEAPLCRESELVHGVEPLRLPNTETSSSLYLEDNVVETSEQEVMVVTPTSSDNNVTVEFHNKLNMRESNEEENNQMQSTIEESLILYKAVKLHGKLQESVYAARNTWGDDSYCDENSEVQNYMNQESEEMTDISVVDTLLPDDFSNSTDYTDATNTIIRHKVHTDIDGNQLTWEQMATLPPAGKITSISAFLPGINDDDDEEQVEGESVLSTDVIRKRLQPIPMSM